MLGARGHDVLLVTGKCEADLDAHTLAVTYGYSRDRWADLKPWMLALATTS
jgi:hypothetical protein